MSEAERKKAHPLVAPVLLTIFSIAAAAFTFTGMSGRTSRLAQEEKLEICGVNCSLDSFGNWEVVFRLNNSGGSPVTVFNVYVNNKEVSLYGSEAPRSAANTITAQLEKNSVVQGRGNIELTVWIGARYWVFDSGSCVTVKILSSNGAECTESIVLV